MGNIAASLPGQVHHEHAIRPEAAKGLSIKVVRRERRSDAGSIERVDQENVGHPVASPDKVSPVPEDDLETLIVRGNVKPLSQLDDVGVDLNHGQACVLQMAVAELDE